MGCGGGAGFDLALEFTSPPMYWAEGPFGEFADEAEDWS